jgi:hypothetical protein
MVAGDLGLARPAFTPFPRTSLRVQIDNRRSHPGSVRGNGQMDGQRRFARPSFLANDGNGFHDEPPRLCMAPSLKHEGS